MLEIGMAVVVYDHKILIAQRQRGRKQELLWEFPGGKIEPGETAEDCIRREFMEELGLPVDVGDFFMDVCYSYPDTGCVHLNTYWATCQTTQTTCMTAHEQIAWVTPAELAQYDFCPADKPFIDVLKTKTS